MLTMYLEVRRKKAIINPERYFVTPLPLAGEGLLSRDDIFNFGTILALILLNNTYSYKFGPGPTKCFIAIAIVSMAIAIACRVK